MAPRFLDVIEWLDLVRRALLRELARVEAATREAVVTEDQVVALRVRGGHVAARLNAIEATSRDVTERWVAGTIDEARAARELAVMLRRTELRASGSRKRRTERAA